MIARPGSAGDSTVLDRHRLHRRRRGGRGGRRRRRGGRRRTSGEAPPASGSCWPPAPTITSPASSTAAAGASVATASTSAPRGVAVDVVAGLLERDGRRDLSDRAISRSPSSRRVLERRALAGRPDLVGTSVAPSGRMNGRQPLGPGRLADRDVDVVDRARRCRCRLLALDLDLAGDGAGGVRDVEVVAGRGEPGERRRAPQPRLRRSRGATVDPLPCTRSGEPVQHAAVDRHDRAADVGGLLRREEAHGRGDLRRRCRRGAPESARAPRAAGRRRRRAPAAARCRSGPGRSC